jgi:hypothetical protein
LYRDRGSNPRARGRRANRLPRVLRFVGVISFRRTDRRPITEIGLVHGIMPMAEASIAGLPRNVVECSFEDARRNYTEPLGLSAEHCASNARVTSSVAALERVSTTTCVY